MAGEQESRLLVLGLRSYIRLSEKRLVGNIFSVKDACMPLLVLRFRSALLAFFIPPHDSFIRVIRPRYLLLRKAKSTLPLHYDAIYREKLELISMLFPVFILIFRVFDRRCIHRRSVANFFCNVAPIVAEYLE